ncbi:MAG: hypothetical protein JSU00_12550 [Acidobacteria bacterium]|mgnify:FL=1|nr:hypothetical protein [Acidobacteriota bacterium]
MTLREKHLPIFEGGRPYFIDEQSWSVFQAYVRDGRTIREIGQELGLSTSKVGMIVARVERELEVPRPPGHGEGRMSLDSPIEDLALSGRARNALRKAGCETIRHLLEKDFSRAVRRLGPITRDEVVTALREHGFDSPPTLAGERNQRLTDLDRELSRLREQIDETSRHWQTRIERLEHRLRKLHEEPDSD